MNYINIIIFTLIIQHNVLCLEPSNIGLEQNIINHYSIPWLKRNNDKLQINILFVKAENNTYK